MVFIFEGMDNCLKDSSISTLRNYLTPKTHILKYGSPPVQMNSSEDYQKGHFLDMFNIMASLSTDPERSIILNRSHLGEYVYAPMYRGYKADWIFDLEKDFFRKHSYVDVLLILLYDSKNSYLKKRDDGQSLSQIDDSNLDKERNLFLEAYRRSSIPSKLKFDLSNFRLPGQNRVDMSQIINAIVQAMAQ